MMFEETSVWNLLSTIASNIGSLTVISGFLFALVKPLRKWLMLKVQKWAGYHENEERDKQTLKIVGQKEKQFSNMLKLFMERLDKIDMDLRNIDAKILLIQDVQVRTIEYEKRELRASIVKIYNEHVEEKRLPIYLKKVLCEKHQTYVEEYDGNSYEHEVYEEMMTWSTYKT